MLDPFAIPFIISVMITIPMLWIVRRKPKSRGGNLGDAVGNSIGSLILQVVSIVAWIIGMLLVWLVYFGVK